MYIHSRVSVPEALSCRYCDMIVAVEMNLYSKSGLFFLLLNVLSHLLVSIQNNNPFDI